MPRTNRLWTRRLVAALAAVMAGVAVGAYTAPQANAWWGRMLRPRLLAEVQKDSSQLASLWISYALGDADFEPTRALGEVDCMRNQPDPERVIALTGMYGDGTVAPPVERRCAIPKNTPITFPLLNCFYPNWRLGEPPGGPCETDAECEAAFFAPAECTESGECFEAATVEEKVAACADAYNYCNMRIALDGDTIYPSVDGPPLFHTVSDPTPGYVNYVCDPGSPLFFTCGAFDPEVMSTGLFAILPGLRRGHHTLEFSGQTVGSDGVCGGEGSFSVGVRYELDAVPRGHLRRR